MIECPIGSKRTHVKISKDKGAHYRLANGEVKTMFHLKAKMIHFLHVAVTLTPIPPSRSFFSLPDEEMTSGIRETPKCFRPSSLTKM